MRTCAFLCTIALLSVPAAAGFSDSHMADSGFYVSGGGGVALVTNTKDTPAKDVIGDYKDNWDFDIGYSLGGAVGYEFGDFRTDAEFSYLAAKFVYGATPDADDEETADDSFAAMALMANVWYDLDTGSAWMPYIGVGLGATQLSVTLKDESSDVSFGLSGWGFAYQAGVGVGYEVVEGFALQLGYQFFGTTKTSVESDAKVAGETIVSVSPTIMAHRLHLGMRYQF